MTKMLILMEMQLGTLMDEDDSGDEHDDSCCYNGRKTRETTARKELQAWCADCKVRSTETTLDSSVRCGLETAQYTRSVLERSCVGSQGSSTHRRISVPPGDAQLHLGDRRELT